MENKHWILVGNSARASLYSRDAGRTSWQLTREAEFTQIDSRRKRSELTTDRAGAVRGHGNDSTHYVSRGDPKRSVAEHFARDLASRLAQALQQGKFARLSLVASNPFLALLDAQLDPHLRKVLTGEVAHDYTQLKLPALQTRLQELLSLPAH